MLTMRETCSYCLFQISSQATGWDDLRALQRSATAKSDRVDWLCLQLL